MRSRMIYSAILSCFVLLVEFMCSNVKGQPQTVNMIEIPRDTAALKDSKMVMLNCTPTPGLTVNWKASVHWDLDMIDIYPTPTPANPNFTTSEGGTTLYIKQLTNDLAAVYRCTVGSQRVDARVAAMEPVRCPTDITRKVGENFTVVCNSGFVSKMLPTIYILDGVGRVVAKKTASDSGPLNLIGNLTAEADMDGTRFSCRVDFLDAPSSRLQPSAPMAGSADYEDLCHFAVRVMHPVTKAEINSTLSPPEVNKVVVGDVINCTANGNPTPDFQWFHNTTNQTLSTSPSLIITEQLNIKQTVMVTCVASKFYDGVLYSTGASVLLFVTSNTEEVKSPAVAPWVIAVAVIVPLLVIFLVVAIIIICCLKRKKGNQPYKATSVPKKKGPYVTTATDEVTFTPNKPAPPLSGQIYNPPAASQKPKNSKPTSPTKNAPARPLYSNDNFNNPSMPLNAGHGALGMTGLNRSQDFHYNSRGQLVESPYSPTPTTNISAVDGPGMVPVKRVEGRQQASNVRSQPPFTNAAETKLSGRHPQNFNNNNNNYDDDDDDEFDDEDERLPVSPPPPKQLPYQHQKPMQPLQQPPYKAQQPKMTRESSVTSGSSARSNDAPRDVPRKQKDGKKSSQSKYTGSGNMVTSPRIVSKDPSGAQGNFGFKTSGNYDTNSLQGSEV
ncbi:hypothetical protein HELRODRAFT_193348 [Helobdella robusta]|uniref:Ig-like domain-containing protein n=1 Tax=Helobdella robusta TaxID=6412 RepID=T1FUW4_HELRO|nr:hypothetical protein HELRODRAFT_193348 [Helobdella robusta]ESN97041.1 hypothetical protein HELRODRAFT_193348 [Helobdella robusta]